LTFMTETPPPPERLSRPAMRIRSLDLAISFSERIINPDQATKERTTAKHYSICITVSFVTILRLLDTYSSWASKTSSTALVSTNILIFPIFSSIPAEELPANAINQQRRRSSAIASALFGTWYRRLHRLQVPREGEMDQHRSQTTSYSLFTRQCDPMAGNRIS
jgi:hypothetical protein